MTLDDMMKVIPSDQEWFTVIKQTGEPNNAITYTYPERFEVLEVRYCDYEKKIMIVVGDQKI